jgi:phosphopantetheine--protein transferase-like protein
MPTPDVDLLFELELPHGRAVGLTIPDAGGLERLAAKLVPEELDLASAWAPARRRTWIAGRAALRTALVQSGLPAPAVLSDGRGAPVLPPGVVASVSHKEHVAVALVARAEPGSAARIGVDVELEVPLRIDIARKVLTDDERAELAALPEPERMAEVRLRFSAKEAIYKALDPFVRRYVGFHEVSVRPRPDGTSQVQMHLPPAEGAFDVEVRWLRRDGLVLTTARVSSGASR